MQTSHSTNDSISNNDNTNNNTRKQKYNEIVAILIIAVNSTLCQGLHQERLSKK